MDRPTFVNFLNANRTFFFNAQLFVRYLPHYNGSYDTNGPFTALGTFAITTGYFQDRLLPSLVLIHDLKSASQGGVIAQVSYRFNESFSATIGMLTFYGQPRNNRVAFYPISLPEPQLQGTTTSEGRRTRASRRSPNATRCSSRCATPVLGSRLRPGPGAAPTRAPCGVRPLGPFVVDVPVGPARQYLVEGDAALDTRQVRSETEVEPVPKLRWWSSLRSTSKRSASGYLRSSRFADPLISRSVEPSGRRVPWCSTSRVTHAGLDRRRRFEAKGLFDRVRKRRRSRPPEPRWSGNRRAARPSTRSGASSSRYRLLREARCSRGARRRAGTPLAVVVLEARVQQLRHQVVGGILGAASGCTREGSSKAPIGPGPEVCPASASGSRRP